MSLRTACPANTRALPSLLACSRLCHLHCCSSMHLTVPPPSRFLRLQEAWVNLLLGELEQASGITPPYTLVLQRREMQDSVAHVDASLEAQQQAQTQWWRRLLERLQLPQPMQRQ